MKIIVSKNKGFCNGVKRAINMALSAKPNIGKKVYCLGEIVHNAKVVDAIQKAGITVIDDLSVLQKGDKLIIRSHGAPPQVYDFCRQTGVEIIDATCAFVKNIQNKAQEYFQKGFKIVLVGDALHPEIIGINGWCDNTAIIYDGNGKLSLNTDKNILVLFQTTFDNDKVNETLKNIVSYHSQIVEFFNTICYTTKDRQQFAEYCSKNSDFVVVVGGKNSSNTSKLFNIASANNKNTIWIQDAMQLPDVSNKKCIGLIAGASTPEELTEEVLSKMMNDAKDNVEVKEQPEQTVEQQEVAAEVKQPETEQELFTRAVEKLEKSPRQFRKGQKVRGTIVQKSDEGIFVSLYTKKEGFMPNDQITASEDMQAAKDALQPGDKIDCIVVSTDKGITLSKKELEILYKDDEQLDGIKAGNKFEVTIKQDVKGGLLAKLGSYTVFVPASHIKLGFAKDLKQYVGKPLTLVALDDGIDESKHKIVASHKIILEREKKEKEDNFWNNIEVGEIVEGKVMRFASFGAFVSVRGVDCLAHLSDLSWNPVKTPDEVLQIGNTYEFVVLKLDREGNRISVGYKQLQPHPWQLAAEKYTPGTIVTGKVARILPYGAFVDLGNGIDGLLHISNISWDWLADINQVVKPGEEIELQVMECDPENKRITLSRKALIPQPEAVKTQSDVEAEQAQEKQAEPKQEEAAEQQKQEEPAQPAEAKAE